jgi:hypothetical protein
MPWLAPPRDPALAGGYRCTAFTCSRRSPSRAFREPYCRHFAWLCEQFRPSARQGQPAHIRFIRRDCVAPLIFLPGITLDFDVPGFVVFNVDFLAFIDHGNFKPDSATTVAACGGYASTYQITPSWFAPFEIAGQKFGFSGFWDFIGSHGTCVSQNLPQTQLRWDVGANFGAPKTAYIGVEYQYWHNKYGFQGVEDNLPQFLFVWTF